MHKKRTPGTEEKRSERIAKEARRRMEGAVAEGKALDAMVKESIKLHGA